MPAEGWRSPSSEPSCRSSRDACIGFMVPGIRRGFHAHKRLNQLFVCVAGSCKLSLSDGKKEETIDMTAFGSALSVGPGLWRVISDLSPDCVLMVLADRPYEEDDYIRDFAAFKETCVHG